MTNYASEFKGHRCIVTGGTGLIGRQVIRLLAEAGAKIISVSLDDLELRNDVCYLCMDLRDEGFKRILDADTAVFHIAGIKGSVKATQERPADFFVPLLEMNTNVLEACRKAGVRDCVYVSSIGAYAEADLLREEQALSGEPMDAFPGWAKRMGELQCHAYWLQYGLQYAVVRPTSVYGPGDNFDPETAMVIPALLARAMGGEDPLVVWGNGSAKRDFLYSTDAAKGIIAAMLCGKGMRCINLGTGRVTPIRELAYAIAKIAGCTVAFVRSRPSGYEQRVMSTKLSSNRLRWDAETPLYEGLQMTWDWLQRNRDEYLKKHDPFGKVLE